MRDPMRRTKAILGCAGGAALMLAACASDRSDDMTPAEQKERESAAVEASAPVAPAPEPEAEAAPESAPLPPSSDAAAVQAREFAQEFERACELVSLDESSAGVMINKKLHSLELGNAYLVTYRGSQAKLLVEYIDLDAPKADFLFQDQRISLRMDFTELNQRLAQAGADGPLRHERIKPTEDSGSHSSSEPGAKKGAVVYGFTQTVGKGASKTKPGAPGAPAAGAPRPPGQPAAPAQLGAQKATPTPAPASRERARTRTSADPTPYAFQPIPVTAQTPHPAPNPNNDPSLPGYVPR